MLFDKVGRLSQVFWHDAGMQRQLNVKALRTQFQRRTSAHQFGNISSLKQRKRQAVRRDTWAEQNSDTIFWMLPKPILPADFL